MGENVIVTNQENFSALEENKKDTILGTVFMGDIVEVHFISDEEALENRHLVVTA